MPSPPLRDICHVASSIGAMKNRRCHMSHARHTGHGPALPDSAGSPVGCVPRTTRPPRAAKMVRDTHPTPLKTLKNLKILKNLSVEILRILNILSLVAACRFRENDNTEELARPGEWIPACAGMTARGSQHNLGVVMGHVPSTPLSVACGIFDWRYEEPKVPHARHTGRLASRASLV